MLQIAALLVSSLMLWSLTGSSVHGEENDTDQALKGDLIISPPATFRAGSNGLAITLVNQTSMVFTWANLISMTTSRKGALLSFKVRYKGNYSDNVLVVAIDPTYRDQFDLLISRAAGLEDGAKPGSPKPADVAPAPAPTLTPVPTQP